MDRTIEPARRLRGTIAVPGDKSISHRAAILNALADGDAEVRNFLSGEDCLSTLKVLEVLGVETALDRSGETPTLRVKGVGLRALRDPCEVLDCGNSGTTMRLMCGVLAGQPFHSVLTGDASLRSRPMARVTAPLREMGARIDGRNDGALAPLSVRGGGLRGIRYRLPVASAQTKSAILLAGLFADGETIVEEPELTRDHTERMLAALGAPVVADGRAVRVGGRANPWDGFDIQVPGDPSSAAFFVVAASITPGSDLTIEELAVNPTRLAFVDALRRMGADIEIEPTGERCGEPVGDLRVRAAALHATTIGGDEIPNLQDEIPALAVAAAFADGVTEVRDAAELALKESNRIGALHQELSELGLAVEARRDGLVIRGGQPRAALLKSHGDHRIAMAAAVAANAIDGESTVRGWQAVSVSYPGFADDLASVTGGW